MRDLFVLSLYGKRKYRLIMITRRKGRSSASCARGIRTSMCITRRRKEEWRRDAPITELRMQKAGKINTKILCVVAALRQKLIKLEVS